MILQPAKTKSMLLATRRKRQLRPVHLHLSLKDSHIEEFHGVIIDDEFRWRSHIIGTCKPYVYSINFFYICYLSQLKHFVDTPKRKLFYHAYISPHLSTVWDGSSDILFHKFNFLHRTPANVMIT